MKSRDLESRPNASRVALQGKEERNLFLKWTRVHLTITLSLWGGHKTAPHFLVVFHSVSFRPTAFAVIVTGLLRLL